MIWFYLLSGLFLGWSLGANDAANVFGTAVGSKMVRFKVAAVVASVFVILGAVISGAGAAHTLGKLGAVNAIAGSFTVALAAAATVAWMTKLSLPVSTSQAIVGAIIGWNLFTGSPTDLNSLGKILSTWVISPILAAVFSILLYKLFKFFLGRARIHLLELDAYTRAGLILVGAFGSYSLGANNIAKVMGVFVPASPFKDLNILNVIHFTGVQQLFLVGGLAIAVGIYTYSYRVMTTVGNEVFKLTPVMALIVVLSESLVLFLFASQSLERWLIAHNLPPIPLVPVSSSQAVIGAVIGIGIAKGGKGINFNILGKIASGWISTPIAAAILSFILLFFMQNVFEREVVRPVTYEISQDVLNKLAEENIPVRNLQSLNGKQFRNMYMFRESLRQREALNESQLYKIFELAEVDSFYIDSTLAGTELDAELFSPEQIEAVKKLHGQIFVHKWQLDDALAQLSPAWRLKPNTIRNKFFNKNILKKRQILYQVFRKRNL
ncbi:inorganic phosphate transporter [Calditrichota bacterium LG25]